MARKKKSKTEEFLAAPEQVKKNKKEMKKALNRKAQLAAYEAQHKALKSKKKPTTEDLLGDMVRVADDKIVNPYWKFRTLSRKRYAIYGHWPVAYIDEKYGTFEHAKQVAGLVDQPGTKLKKAARAQSSKREHAARYVKRYVKPYVIKDPALHRTLKGDSLWLFISDTHSTFMDPFTWQVFLSSIRDLQPDGVYFNGDILECQEISRFPKIPGWTVGLQMEFDFIREMFKQVRMWHDGPIVWGGGNHGIDRLAMYLTQVAPALSGLRTLRFDRLAGLEDLGVTLAQGGTIASPEGEENDRMGMLLYDFYRVHHGTRLGQCPALSELLSMGRSGTSGHCHRGMVVHGSTEALQGLSWMSTPAACTELAARAYIKGNTGWQRGFGLAHLFADGTVSQYPIITNSGRAIVEGHVYEKLPGCRDQDPSKLWIKDIKVLS